MALTYSGCRARHDACVAARRAAWHSAREHVRCRSPTLAPGENHLRHCRHGRFLAAMAAIVVCLLARDRAWAPAQLTRGAPLPRILRVTSREHRRVKSDER